ncbi:FAD-dependent monooxygenase [Streptomyces sp. A3M-1-3]|uniref:FAD-dependent oxidoreductase n=1 Tax=Streptomyces sp. A3M-1-3 TaxID=2962044 RepID=UPI0020B87943|nr:NAD(P)/FAD-dependent oxidoreductase [Streptomyces sp. A3M-1-3]MCP3820199.1 FAD-dependent monooxygenase [Streptomyces sp. A3M-1-3]
MHMQGNDGSRADGDPEIVIVGAGLVGAVAAMYLAPRSGPVTMLEKRADPRRGAGRSGRSITVMLSARGWRVLSDLGLEQAVREISVPLHGRCAHLPDGSSHVTPYSRDGQPIWSVERERLHHLLLDAAEATPGVRIRFEQQVHAVDLEEPAVLVEDQGGRHRLACRRVLGCDGAHSTARDALVARNVRAQVRNLELAYQEIQVPGGWLDRRTMHYWPTGDALFAAFPMPSGEFAGSLFMRLDGPTPSFATVAGGQDLSEVFAARFPEPTAVIPDLAEQLATKSVSTISLVNCDRWVWRDTFALLGDSCHAMAPFMGHGMNCGFEDARTLVDCLDQAEDWTAALAAYEKSRIEDASAISYLSYQHYYTMANPPQDDTSHAEGLLRRRLGDLFPDRFVPLYEQCAFTEESYASVLRNDQNLDRLVESLLRRYGTELVSASDSRLRACMPVDTDTVTLEDSGCS